LVLSLVSGEREKEDVPRNIEKEEAPEEKGIQSWHEKL